MAEIIEVNFKTKRKIEKYVVTERRCVNCRTRVINDSRKAENTPCLQFKGDNTNCLCKECAILVKETVDELGWE